MPNRQTRRTNNIPTRQHEYLTDYPHSPEESLFPFTNIWKFQLYLLRKQTKIVKKLDQLVVEQH